MSEIAMLRSHSLWPRVFKFAPGLPMEMIVCEIREEPSESAKSVGRLAASEQAVVTALEANGSWLHVYADDVETSSTTAAAKDEYANRPTAWLRWKSTSEITILVPTVYCFAQAIADMGAALNVRRQPAPEAEVIVKCQSDVVFVPRDVRGDWIRVHSDCLPGISNKTPHEAWVMVKTDTNGGMVLLEAVPTAADLEVLVSALEAPADREMPASVSPQDSEEKATFEASAGKPMKETGVASSGMNTVQEDTPAADPTSAPDVVESKEDVTKTPSSVAREAQDVQSPSQEVVTVSPVRRPNPADERPISGVKKSPTSLASTNTAAEASASPPSPSPAPAPAPAPAATTPTADEAPPPAAAVAAGRRG